MRVYGIWCNKQKAWYTNGKNFLANGVPKTWSRLSNPQATIRDMNRWMNRYNPNQPYDLRLVIFDLTPVDNKHLV